MIIAIDFDGTCVTHEYPKVGQSIGAEEVLRELMEEGHQLILWTMRSNKELTEAVEWFVDKEIDLFGINENPEQDWSDSPKAYAEMYIDDMALGCPLRTAVKIKKPFVDWKQVRRMLVARNILTN